MTSTWTVDVMGLIRDLKTSHFSLDDLYSRIDLLHDLHPENHHIQEKIRQQLQVLRDKGIIEFLGNGQYRLRAE